MIIKNIINHFKSLIKDEKLSNEVKGYILSKNKFIKVANLKNEINEIVN